MVRSIRKGRGDRPIANDVVRAFVGFRTTLDHVEAAKAALAAAAPRGRTPGLPLAEALAGFEQELDRAVASMDTWRTPVFEERWAGCRSALAISAELAEALRVGGAAGGYEGLYGTLADLMEPLDTAFQAALDRFGELGL